MTGVKDEKPRKKYLTAFEMTHSVDRIIKDRMTVSQ